MLPVLVHTEWLDYGGGGSTGKYACRGEPASCGVICGVGFYPWAAGFFFPLSFVDALAVKRT